MTYQFTCGTEGFTQALTGQDTRIMLLVDSAELVAKLEPLLGSVYRPISVTTGITDIELCDCSQLKELGKKGYVIFWSSNKAKIGKMLGIQAINYVDADINKYIRGEQQHPEEYLSLSDPSYIDNYLTLFNTVTREYPLFEYSKQRSDISTNGSVIRYFYYREDYTTAQNPVALVVKRISRQDGSKDIKQGTLDNGEFIPGQPKEFKGRLPLFNYPEISDIAEIRRPVMIVEGEKAAVAAIRKLKGSYVVTTGPGGSSNAKQVNWGLIQRDRRVVFWPDNDEPGQKYIRDIATILGLRKISVVKIPANAKPGYDAADDNYIPDRNDFETITVSKIEAAPAYKELDLPIEDVLDTLKERIPEGQLRGREYLVRNPHRNDSKLGSFSINIDTQMWADFALSEAKGSGIKGFLHYYTTGEIKQPEFRRHTPYTKPIIGNVVSDPFDFITLDLLMTLGGIRDYGVKILTPLLKRDFVCIGRNTDVRHWLHWNGKVWHEPMLGELIGACTEYFYDFVSIYRRLFSEAINNAESDEHAASIGKIMNLGIRQVIQPLKDKRKEEAKMLELIPPLSKMPATLDSNPTLFNCENGTIDLRTGALLPFNKDNYITRSSSINYNPHATCQRWEQFLDEITREAHEDRSKCQELKQYLQILFGYYITGYTSEQIFPILFGRGGNGKSLMVKVIMQIMGSYADNGPGRMLSSERQEQHLTELAAFDRRRFIFFDEGVNSGASLKQEFIKDLTGGAKTIKVRGMRENSWDMPVMFKLIMASNVLPTIQSADRAIWRRIRLVPFRSCFENNGRNNNLEDVLLQESEGILLWLVNGSRKWLEASSSGKTGLPPCYIIEETTHEYSMQQNNMAAFIDECCDIKDRSARVNASVFGSKYREWATGSGRPRLNATQIHSELAGLGYANARSSNGMVWIGIQLKLGTTPF